MSVIDVADLTFSYDGSYSNVFENVSFRIDTDWKLGFIGRNGRGKTTFLNLLMGKYEYGGTISAKVDFVYFPFEVKDPSRYAADILSEICPAAQEWEIMRELSLLDVSSDALYRPFSSLSGGEKTKALLAGLFLREGGFLLIDEPTNHLDANARDTVAKYLKSKKGFILVSHDRAFLDGCVDHIMSINKTNIEIRSGNFSSWFSDYEKTQASEKSRNEKLKKDIDRLTDAARRTAAWADKTEASKYGKAKSGLKQDRGAVGHKAAKMMKRALVTEKRQLKAAEEKAELFKNTETSDKLKLSPLTHRAEKYLSLTGVCVSYGERKILDGVNFDIKRGERVALNGRNGSGKSTLLKLIAARENIPYSGRIDVAPNLIISYIPQYADGICGTLSEYAENAGISESLFKAILHKTGFTKKDFDVEISAYSAGQKRKVLLAKSLCKQAHLYVWDEPLNYIDIFSRIQIENLLKEFSPTIVFVEHDKAFRDAIATKIIDL